MNRYDRRRSLRRRRAWRATRPGQSLTELAIIVPLLCVLLFGLVDLSGAFGAKMSVQAAAGQGARIGALEGSGGTGAWEGGGTNSVDMDILKAISNTAGLAPANIQQVQIFRAAPDGSIDGGAVDTYPTPFSNTATSPYTVSASTYNWPLSQRFSAEPADSIGIHITYKYHPFTPLFGRATFAIDDGTVQRLNPTSGQTPCPIPGVPISVTATVSPTNLPPDSPYDDISWAPVPGATDYAVYADVNGAGFGTYIYSGTVSMVNGQMRYEWNRGSLGPYLQYAPTLYEVTGTNYCGEGFRSLAQSDNQCTLPVTPTNVITAVATTPDTDVVSWNAVSGAMTYTITQTPDSPPPVTYTLAAPPGTVITDTVPNPGYAHQKYQVTATSACGVIGPANAPPVDNGGCAVPGTPTLSSPVTTTATIDKLRWTYTGNPPSSWEVYQNLITATVTLTQVVPMPSTSVVMSNTNDVKANYAVQGLSSCGGRGPTSNVVLNGR